MKFFSLMPVLATIVALAMMTSVFAAPKKGGENSGGGDEYTIDFVQKATLEIYPWLIKNGKSLNPPVKASDFLMKINPEKLESLKNVYESCDGSKIGREVSACYNSKEDKIYLSRTRYPLLPSSTPAKLGLVAHEIFRKMKIEGDRYEITRQIPIVSVPNSKNEPTIVRWTVTDKQYIKDSRFPTLGNAWRDERGLIWGQVVRDTTGPISYNPKGLSYKKFFAAREYCEATGNRLPTIKELDSLRLDLGYGSAIGFTTKTRDGNEDVLEGLSKVEHLFSDEVNTEEGGYQTNTFFSIVTGTYFLNRLWIGDSAYNFLCVRDSEKRSFSFTLVAKKDFTQDINQGRAIFQNNALIVDNTGRLAQNSCVVVQSVKHPAIFTIQKGQSFTVFKDEPSSNRDRKEFWYKTVSDFPIYFGCWGFSEDDIVSNFQNVGGDFFEISKQKVE